MLRDQLRIRTGDHTILESEGNVFAQRQSTMSALRIARPGEPVRLVHEAQPALTARQEHVLHVVRSFRGNQHAAARHLGITYQAVHGMVEAAVRRGARKPPKFSRKGVPELRRRVVAPRCGVTMQLRGDRCGRPIAHPGFHRSEHV